MEKVGVVTPLWRSGNGFLEMKVEGKEEPIRSILQEKGVTPLCVLLGEFLSPPDAHRCCR